MKAADLARRGMTLAMRKSHEDLQADLAAFLEAQGLIVAPRFQLPHAGQQIDVLSISRYSYAKPDVRAYEIKVSRSDFLADVGAAKWTGYTRYANRVLFAAESGLLKEADIPAEAGLIVRGPKGWVVVKTGQYRLQIPGWDNDAWLALLSRRQEHQTATRRLADRAIWEENAPLRDRAKNLGWTLREAISRRPGAKQYESDRGERLWQFVRELYPEAQSEHDVQVLIRSAYQLRKRARAIEQIASFLAGLSWGDSKQSDQREREVLDAVREAAS